MELLAVDISSPIYTSSKYAPASEFSELVDPDGLLYRKATELNLMRNPYCTVEERDTYDGTGICGVYDFPCGHFCFHYHEP
jgi:hypothetical protein